MGLWSGLTRNRASTDPRHEDPRLRGRTYAIPFVKVWGGALELASGGLRGWTLVEADEDRGILRAESTTPVFRFVDDVRVEISLDEYGQTRVDAVSSSRTGKGDLGTNARRIRKFFRALDERVGADARTILDPTRFALGTGVLLFLSLSFPALACSPGADAPRETGPTGEEPPAAERNFQGRAYERHIVFLAAQGDSSLVVPWFFTARTRPGGVDRSIHAWLARSGTWDPFVSEVWDAPATRVPWQIIPRGRARIIVGMGNTLERIFFEEGPRQLEVVLGELLMEWTGQRAQTFRIHRGSTTLSASRVEGFVLDMARAWTVEDPAPGDWAFLLSGDSVQLVLEDLSPGSGPDGGSFSGRGRLNHADLQWEDLQLAWTQTRSFEPARRDVPTAWEVRSAEEALSGSLVSVSPFLEVGDGDGPVLPVHALYQVSGTILLEGREIRVRGLIRHQQR